MTQSRSAATQRGALQAASEGRRRGVRFASAFLLCILVAERSLGQEKARASARPRHLQIALQLLDEVSAAHASYRHKNNVVKRKAGDAPAVCHADCSGLVNWLLLEGEGRPEGGLQRWFGANRPVARHYHDAIVAEKHFQRIRRMEDCLPGDVIAMKYPEGNANTGHVMIAAERPKQRPATAPLVPDSEQWEATIIDSTRSPHGSDSRRLKDGSRREGIGMGIVRIYANADGEPIGFTWGMSAQSEFRAMKDRPIVIGRFQPNRGDSVKKAAAHLVPPGGFIHGGK
jgi:hypothetical protein